MSIEYLENLKEKYTEQYEYFNTMGFNHLASDYREMISAIDQMIDYIKKVSEENKI